MPSATTGNMTWGEIREAYLTAAGNSTAARQEAFAHLSQGFRWVVQTVDVPEVYGEAQIEVGKDPREPSESSNPFADFIDLDVNVHSIFRVFNLTIGAPVYREPSGIRGRDRYIDRFTQRVTTPGSGLSSVEPKPPPGQVRWWVRHGQRIYIRDTPAPSTIAELDGTTLRISYRVAVDAITQDDINDHPFTPAHYDWAIVHKSAGFYYKAHRDAGGAEEGGQPKAMFHDQAAAEMLNDPNPVDAEEEKDSFHRMRVAGYQVTPRSRR